MKRRMFLALAGVVAAAVFAPAQVVRIDRFRGTVVNVKDQAGTMLNVDLHRWSTDAERDKVTAAVASNGDTVLAKELEGLPTLGYIWTGESVGCQIRYAYRLPLPNGGERIIVATDRRLGSYHIKPWEPAAPAAATSYPFTVIEIRLAKSGAGEAKMSLTTKVVANAAAKTITLDNYEAAPVLVKNVRHASAT